MLDRMRWRLTLGYAGIFALILLLLSTAAVFGFARELTNQQDILLTQEAKDQARNLLDEDNREVLAEGSAEYSWVALDPSGRITDRDPTAATLSRRRSGSRRTRVVPDADHPSQAPRSVS